MRDFDFTGVGVVNILNHLAPEETMNLMTDAGIFTKTDIKDEYKLTPEAWKMMAAMVGTAFLNMETELDDMNVPAAMKQKAKEAMGLTLAMVTYRAAEEQHKHKNGPAVAAVALGEFG